MKTTLSQGTSVTTPTLSRGLWEDDCGMIWFIMGLGSSPYLYAPTYFNSHTNMWNAWNCEAMDAKAAEQFAKNRRLRPYTGTITLTND